MLILLGSCDAVTEKYVLYRISSKLHSTNTIIKFTQIHSHNTRLISNTITFFQLNVQNSGKKSFALIYRSTNFGKKYSQRSNHYPTPILGKKMKELK